MEQHPIPQQISAYQFRLVGDMTIKQFFQVAGGALVALLIYSSGLSPYIKWPLIVISFLFGIALAFFPLEDRPLSKWIFLFFKAIYSPTVYKWKKVEPKPEYFQAEGATQPIAQPITIAPPIVSPPTLTGPVAPTEPERTAVFAPESQPISEMGQVVPNVSVPEVKSPQERLVVIPTSAATQVENQEKEFALEKPEGPLVYTSAGFEISPSTGQIAQGARAAQFTPEASPPTPPTKANVIVGQATDPEGKIIENAILEIKDVDGRAVRALRSNKLGHFMIVTPLLDGNYQIITEKEGFFFDPISFEAAGQIIPSISIIGKVNDILPVLPNGVSSKGG